MRYFIDTEFDDTGSTIELISIALVREDGESLYLVSAEFDPNKCNDWLKANVLPILGDAQRSSRSTIATSIERFLIGDSSLGKPEIWGYFADYDFVAFCQLWGRMLDLPKGFPMLCMDIKQWSKQLGIDIKGAVPPPLGSHNALVDAQWNRAAYEHLAAIDAHDGQRSESINPSEWPAPWDALDCRGRMWGIFTAEGYSADPIALFSRQQDALDWMTWQASRGDDNTLGNCDFTVCPVDALTGQAWNSHDAPPTWRGAS